MKKYYITILTLLVSINIFSQQPYYSGINSELTSETGLTLFGTLATLTINEHTNSLSYSDIWDACDITDLDPNDGTNSNVLLIYGWEDGSDGDATNDLTRSVTLHNSGGSGDGTWNREHTFANSLADPSLNDSGTSGPPYADAHNLRACDVDRNSSRGNRLFSAGSGNSAQTGAYWYPGDDSVGGTDWRGDVARIVMYMYLRYGNQCYPNLVANGTANSVDSNMIDLLLDWNAVDPVSAYEDARNTYHDSNSGGARQGNRNPFIDNPHLATRIWGGTPAEDRWGIYGTDTVDPSIPTNLIVSNETSTTIDLDWTASTDNVGVTGYDIYVDGMLNSSTTTNSHTVTGLAASTTFSFTVLAKDLANNMSAQSTAVDGTTTAGSSGSNNLFISEYVEGSSNNKAIEIANFTGGNIDLSDYSLARNVSGGPSWDPAFSLTGTLNNNDVVVIVNSSAGATLLAFADITVSTTTALQFNGNDPVGLFENGTLIDIVGTFNGGSANFAINTTLVRNSNVQGPRTDYTISEWTSSAQDTFVNLGSHSFVLSVEENTLFSEIKLYPNPINGNTLYIDTNEELEIKIIDILGKELILSSVSQTNNQVDISTLKQGTYFIKLNSKKGSVTKKLIKQ